MRGEKTTEVDLLTAAYLAGEGKKQTEIAELLGLSQAVVSRLLKKAEMKYLRKETRFLKEKVDPLMMQQIIQKASRRDLGKGISSLCQHDGKRWGPTLRVFPSGGQALERGERLAAFARQAAAYARDLMLNAHVCGVTWGGMLGSVVQALKEASFPPPWATHRIEFIPLAGETLGEGPTRFSSSSIAYDLTVLANGQQNSSSYYLGMVPAFIPESQQFSKDELKGVWKLIRMVKSYNQIFGSGASRPEKDKPLADTLDMILTSVGPAENPLSYGKGKLFEAGKVTYDELKQLVSGDIGGVCLPRTGLNKAQQEKLESVNRRWTGLQRRHLESCARRAFAFDSPFSGNPGVVVISMGASRARLIIEMLKLGLVNHLIIDEELEAELDRLLKASETGSPTRDAVLSSSRALHDPGLSHRPRGL